MGNNHDLPDRTICRTEPYAHGTKGLYVCRVENSYFCRYSLSFGYSFYFCYHDNREEMACCRLTAVDAAEPFTEECVLANP